MPTITLGSDILKKGLRPTKRNPRNSGYLIESKGAVGLDGVLQAIDELASTLTSATHILNFDAQTGSFTAGNTITGATSGATATIEAVWDNGTVGTLNLSSVSGTFQDDEFIYESLGSDLVTDGDCSSDSFTKGDGWAYDAINEDYDCDGSQAGTSLLQQAGVAAIGGVYRIGFILSNYSAGSVAPRLGTGTGEGASRTANGTYYDGVVTTSGTLILAANSSFVGTVDNIETKALVNYALANGAASEIAFDTFPYPQLFVGTNHIIVCYQTQIYEWVSGTLVLKITASVAGSTWTCVESHDYIYLSNGQVSIERNPQSNAYAETTLIPTAMSSCNFNGQVLLGSPDVATDGVDLVALDSIITVTVTPIGSIP